MADDNINVGVKLDVTSTGVEDIGQLQREIIAMARNLKDSDSKATKALQAKTNALMSVTSSIKAQTSAIDRYNTAAESSRRLDHEIAESHRKIAKERAVDARERTARQDRLDNKAERSAKQEEGRVESTIRRILRLGRVERDAFIERLNNGTTTLKAEAKRWNTMDRLERLNHDAALKRTDERHKDQLYLQKLKDRSFKMEERDNKQAKTTSDARQRHFARQAETVRGLNQFLTRHTELLAYRGEHEEHAAVQSMQALRSHVAGALVRYRADQRVARQRGIYDAAEEQRIQNRFQNEVKAGRRSFGIAMAVGRAKQQQADRVFRYEQKLQRDYQRQQQAFRADAFRGASGMVHHGGNFMQAARMPGYAALAAAGGAGLAVKKGISSQYDINKAETALQIFGSEPAYKIENKDGSVKDFAGSRVTPAQIAKIRNDWLDKAAIENGMGPAAAIRAYTETIKAGIDTSQAKDVTKLLLESNAAMDLPLQEVTRIVGKIAQNRPNLGPEGIRGILTAMGISAGSTAADPTQIVSGLQRGMGVFAMSNMDPRDLVAMVATGAGAGIQEGKTGNFVAELVSTIMTAGKENPKHQRGKDLNAAFKMLNMGNNRSVSAQGEQDITATLIELLENFNGLDARQRSFVARKLGGREWDDEIMQFVNSIETLKRVKAANKDPRNANYIDVSKNAKMGSWEGMWSRAKATFELFWGKFGEGFNEILTAISQTFQDFSKNFDANGITEGVKSAFEGIKAALDISSWREALKNLFGDVGKLNSVANLRDIRKFFKGFTEGVMQTVNFFRDALKMFGVNTSDAANLGKLAGQIISISLAALALAPVISIISGLVSIVLAFASAARMVGGLAGMAGIIGEIALAANAVAGGAATAAGGGVAAAAGISAAAAGWAVVGTMIAAGFVSYLVKKYTPSLETAEQTLGGNGERGKVADGAIEVVKEYGGVFGYLGAIFKSVPEVLSSAMGNNANGSVPDPRPAEEMTFLQRMGITARNAPANRIVMPTPLAPNGPVQSPNGSSVSNRTIFRAPTIVGPTSPPDTGQTLQQRATEENNRQLQMLNETMDDTARFQRQSLQEGGSLSGLIHKAAILSGTTGLGTATSTLRASGSSGGISGLTAGSNGIGSAPLEGSTPGSRMGGGGGLGYRGIIGGATSARGSGPGSGGVSSSSMVGYGANPSAYKPVLDFIAGTEGTANQAGGGYNTSLGYGKFLPGKQEQNLTGKTLDQIDAMQTGMLNHPENGFNSSAIGRYQIVRKTLRGLRQKLGLKGSDMYDEKMQDRLGAELVRQRGASVSGLGSEWASLRGGKAQQAASLVGSIPQGSSTTPSDRPIADGVIGPVTAGAAASAADNASKLIGSGSSQAAMQLGSRMTPGQWCADFVNGSLKSANIKGVNSSIANSFLNWGQQVTDGVKKGDVLVEHRGRGAGNPGGHAGIATGRQRMHNGQLQYEQVSGNYGNKVAINWENASGVVARRANESIAEAKAAAASAKKPAEDLAELNKPYTSTGWRDKSKDWSQVNGGRWVDGNGKEASEEKNKYLNEQLKMGRKKLFGYGTMAPFTSSGWKKPDGTLVGSELTTKAEEVKSSGWKKGWGKNEPVSNGSSVVDKGEAVMEKTSLGNAVPPRQSNVQPQMTQAAARGGAGGNGASAPTIHVNGAGMQAEAVANAVQRQLTAQMNRRTHDIDHTYT